MASKYIFVWDTETEEFPERYRVERTDETGLPDDGDALNGVVVPDKVDLLHADLKKRFPPPRYSVDGQHGTRWATIERLYASMR